MGEYTAEITALAPRKPSDLSNIHPGSLHFVYRASRKNRLALVLSEPFAGRDDQSVYVVFVSSHLSQETAPDLFVPIQSTGRTGALALCNSLCPVDLCAFRQCLGTISPEEMTAVKAKLGEVLQIQH